MGRRGQCLQAGVLLSGAPWKMRGYSDWLDGCHRGGDGRGGDGGTWRYMAVNGGTWRYVPGFYFACKIRWFEQVAGNGGTWRYMAVRFNCQFAALIKLNRAPRRLHSSENAPLGPGGLRWSLPVGTRGTGGWVLCDSAPRAPARCGRGRWGSFHRPPHWSSAFLAGAVLPLDLTAGWVLAVRGAWPMERFCPATLCGVALGCYELGNSRKHVFFIFGIGPLSGNTLNPPCAKTPLWQ